MIKFFRKIRQNLIMENKTSKYFKYAIGEIILVVIGILIALSINNWNENRKSESNKQKLMLALKKEFSINKKTLENHSLGLHKSNSQLNKVINYSAGAIDLSIDSLRLYASNLTYETRLSMLNSVLEEAISPSKFEMLSDSIKQRLSLLKDFLTSRNDLSKMGDDILYNKNGLNTDFMLNLNAFQEQNNEKFYVQPPISMHPDYIKSDAEFINYIKSSKTYEKLHQVYYFSKVDEVWITYGLLGLTNQTIDLLERELKE
ncbi:MAG: hypothetical protein DA407_01170 [Bacteroidetes bacterium]|nr:MAG: hypothetical protein DA407_01170 [Bacteroidota bacterium]